MWSVIAPHGLSNVGSFSSPLSPGISRSSSSSSSIPSSVPGCVCVNNVHTGCQIDGSNSS